jgi:hypothetical protein
MTALRRALGPLTAGWLFCQMATLIVLPAVFWARSADAAYVECTCATGAHSTCPMHHKTAPGSKTCALGNVSDSAAVAVSSLLGPVGLVPSTTRAVMSTATDAFPVAELAKPSLHPVPPDPPPPRP